jgi:hypothetical protein
MTSKAPRAKDASFQLNEALMQFQQEQEDVNFDAVLTDYDWKVGGDASALEARLTNELMALDAVNGNYAIVTHAWKRQMCMLSSKLRNNPEQWSP